MDSQDVLGWITVALLAAGVALMGWNFAAYALRKQARRRRYEVALAQEQVRREAAMRGLRRHALRSDQAEAIRREAEAAALQVTQGHGGEAPNPYRPGTPEFVLWLTTYHLALIDLPEMPDQPPHEAQWWRTPSMSDR